MRFVWQVRVESADDEGTGRHSRFWAVVLGFVALCLLVLVVSSAVWIIEGIVARRG